jgi:D-glycero-alpha-D-manno-heptose-7-phosphate kinase
MFKKDLFTISETRSLKEAMAKIQENTLGVVFLCDPHSAVVAILSDGDIRRYLIGGGGIDDPTSKCGNYDFIWGGSNSTRESILKKLDSRICKIPILDADRRLVDLVTRDNFPARSEQPTYARARAPVRISFGGGGSDLTHYFTESEGAVINTAITLYSHATLKLRQDDKIKIVSRDLNGQLEADNIRTALSKPGNFGLIQAVLKTVDPNCGFELYLHSDFQIGSGLGGSATLAVTILACFNQFRVDRWDPYEIAELAYQAERLTLGVSGGWQDQYAAVFGGFNFIEFREEKNIVHPLRIDSNIAAELEECLVLCDTRIEHDSGRIHDHQREQLSQRRVKESVGENVRICYELRDLLLKGDLSNFGALLDKSWSIKKRFSNRITTTYIDELYDGAKQNGALGGKLLGAGGGGHLIFFTTPQNKFDLIGYLESRGLAAQPFRFENEGVKSWVARERSHIAEANY